MPWDLGDVPGRKPSLRLEDIYDMTTNAEDNYPESVWAPPHGEPIVVSNFIIYTLTFDFRY